MESIQRAMKLDHLSFPSRDVAATAAFLKRHLDCTAAEMGRKRVLKRDDFGIVIEDATDRPVDWPGNCHIGFELPTAQALRALQERFQADGVELQTALITHARGSRFIARLPGGALVELNTWEDADKPCRAGFRRA